MATSRRVAIGAARGAGPALVVRALGWLAAWVVIAQHALVLADGPRYFHTPMLEVMDKDIYLTVSEHQETTIAYSGKGSDLHQGDYVTHADGIRILNGGLKAFLKNGDNEAIVPIVDEDEVQHGGSKLLGFVLVQVVNPRKLSTRRGEVVLDFDEGGPAPTLNLGNLVVTGSGAKSISDPSYQPPPYGGGPCITAKDCNMYNGTCSSSKCSCLGPFTGTFCQLNRPESAAISMMMRKNQQKLQEPRGGHQRTAQGVDSFTSKRDTPGPPVGSTSSSGSPSASASAAAAAAGSSSSSAQANPTENKDASADPSSSGTPKKKKKKPMPKKKPDAEKQPEAVAEWSRDDPAGSPGQSGGGRAGSGGGGSSPTNDRGGSDESGPSPPEQAATVEDLYGDGKAYPEPNTAGRPPASIIQDRYRRRHAREVFMYSVRYRSGPLGLVFDNKITNATVVEKVIKGQQSELSDVKEGDVLIAIDQFNVTIASAKVSQRVLGSLPWPRILVFQTRYSGEDPSVIQQKITQRTFNASVVFPPTLTGGLSFRLAEWAPQLQLFAPLSARLRSHGDDFCPLYRVKTAQEDIFGCRVASDEYRIPTAFDEMVEANGFVDTETEQASPFLALVLQEARARGVVVEVRSLAVMKRGLCTFVEKSRALTAAGADLGLVVNTEDEVIDMPSGKEVTQDSTVPIGLTRLSEGEYLHLAARTNEVWVIASDNSGAEDDGYLRPACQRLMHVVEDVVDKWPHSVPELSVAQVKAGKAPDQTKIRGLTEEGGRMALSGENGWVFFDYHLAMFGPQEVPLGPFRMVMAMPPFGCDPNAYSVRIAGAVVAILRGGGCSFGIKVINAQKLGAKAVVIVNTDDMKTMRLMALPDEVPLIKIPCVMVSRRIQFYVEEKLRPYYPLSQHLVSIQPTGVFGDYEQKNMLKLPARLQA